MIGALAPGSLSLLRLSPDHHERAGRSQGGRPAPAELGDPRPRRDPIGAFDLEALADQLHQEGERELQDRRVTAEEPRSGEGPKRPEQDRLHAVEPPRHAGLGNDQAPARAQHPLRLADRAPHIAGGPESAGGGATRVWSPAGADRMARPPREPAPTGYGQGHSAPGHDSGSSDARRYARRQVSPGAA